MLSRAASRRRERPPRLVLRFAVVTAVGLALAGAVILTVVRSLDVRQAERAAIDHARYAIGALVHDQLVATDLRRDVVGARRTSLDRLFEARVLIASTFRLSLVRPDGRVTYSTDHALIGTPRPSRASGDGTARAVSTVEGVPSPGTGTNLRALVTAVPVVVGKRDRVHGIVVLEQEYAPIAAAASDAFLPIAGVLEVVLVLFFLLLVPSLARTTSRIRKHAEQIEATATHDPVTGLANRSGLHRALASLPSSDRTAVVLVDLDRFREVNAALGHECGDEVLRRVAQALEATARGAAVARVGGDEFAVVRPIASRGEAIELAQRIRLALESPVTLDGVPVQVTISAGVALAPDHGTELDALLQHAEIAMYAAKRDQSGVALYDAEADTSSAERLALMAELRDALQAGDLEVWFQPIVALRAAKMIGMEALVRWRHERLGMIGPDQFVPLLDHMGLLRPLHRLVLEKALASCRVWNDKGVELSVSINITARDLLDPALPDEVGDALARHGVAPRLLVLEITESTLMTDAERARRSLERLAAIGVRTAIDDFGTGYSSLAYLQRLPVHAIKLDRSFVAGMLDDPSSAAIVRTTVDLGRTLGLVVVAEGIEEEEQWQRLAELGCRFGQGYLFGRTLEPEGVVSLIEADASPVAA
jgi:diguanylate cyclase (GGDEF)-like protein